MEKYMGYEAKAPKQRPERLLPEINIAETLFHVDIEKLEFRQVGDPSNRMPIIGAKEEMGFSHFFFDTKTKNLFTGDTKMPDGIPGHVRIVLLPPLKELDPIGLARQQGLPDEFHNNNRSLKEKTIVFSKKNEPKPQQQPAIKKPRRQKL
ncbi:hypothetical protein [Mucilaginibacter pineti]|nr:hypothetical protein [Mucilaginibacter pineti]